MYCFNKYLEIKNYSFNNAIINALKVQKNYDMLFYWQYLLYKKRYFDYPIFDSKNSLKVINNEGGGKPVVIIFQGFYSQYLNDYLAKNRNLENLGLLNESGLDFAFGGFVRENQDFNYILVKDNYQSWYTVNFDLYLRHIIERLIILQPSQIFTIGFSAGGFAAILFGHYLKANLVFAYSAQTLAFYHFQNEYRQKLNAKYQISQNSIFGLELIQKVNNGFNCKVDFSLCKNNVVDVQELNLLNLKSFRDIEVIYHNGDSHNVFSVCDKLAEFQRVRDRIISFNSDLKKH